MIYIFGKYSIRRMLRLITLRLLKVVMRRCFNDKKEECQDYRIDKNSKARRL